MKELVNVIECLEDGGSVDFGKHIIPMSLAQGYQVGLLHHKLHAVDSSA